MTRPLLRLMILLMTVISAFVCAFPSVGLASSGRIVRLGYLDHPGSALCRIASTKGHFTEEGLTVELVRFDTSLQGLAALESGLIDVGAFGIGDSLRSIAGGRGFRIIAGGGAPRYGNLLAELDDEFKIEIESRGIVVLIPRTWPNEEKGTIIQLTAALVKAYRTYIKQPHVAAITIDRLDEAIQFDPNPDYWRLDRIWHALKLQSPTMKRDFLATHVYEEIYCDALDRLLLGDIDPILQQLFSKAICTPNCCPASAAKL